MNKATTKKVIDKLAQFEEVKGGKSSEKPKVKLADLAKELADRREAALKAEKDEK